MESTEDCISCKQDSGSHVGIIDVYFAHFGTLNHGKMNSCADRSCYEWHKCKFVKLKQNPEIFKQSYLLICTFSVELLFQLMLIFSAIKEYQKFAVTGNRTLNLKVRPRPALPRPPLACVTSTSVTTSRDSSHRRAATSRVRTATSGSRPSRQRRVPATTTISGDDNDLKTISEALLITRKR